MTADISDGGCSLLWPERLEPRHRMLLRFHFGVRSVDWHCEVTSAGGHEDDGWYRYGVRFMDLTQADVDLINDSIFSLVVPDLFLTLNRPARLVRWGRRLLAARRAPSQVRARRQNARVPVRVTVGDRVFTTTVRDLSASGLSFASPEPIDVGAQLEIEMFGPGRTWRGEAVVARSETRRSRPGFDTWILGLRFGEQQIAEDIEPFRRWDAA